MKDARFGGPATYRILVHGRLEESWLGRLGDFAFSSVQRGGEPQTLLTGAVRDQTELRGILDSLHELHLPILRVEQIEDEPRDPRSVGAGA